MASVLLPRAARSRRVPAARGRVAGLLAVALLASAAPAVAASAATTGTTPASTPAAGTTGTGPAAPPAGTGTTGTPSTGATPLASTPVPPAGTTTTPADAAAAQQAAAAQAAAQQAAAQQAAAQQAAAQQAAAQQAAAKANGVVVHPAETDDSLEGWVWAAVVGGILLAAALAWGLVLASGRVERLAPLGHALGEAGWRLSARWAEFTDWLRLGSGR